MARDGPQIVSYRHLLTASLEAFLREIGLRDDDSAHALAELVVVLSRYREEGSSLFPVVFYGDDLERLLLHVGGRDPIYIGRGGRSPETVRRALKHCASLGVGAWSVFIERAPDAYVYGVFRVDAFVLQETPIERLRMAEDPELHAIGIVQLADNVLELCGPRYAGRYVFLSGARIDLAPTPVVIGKLVRSATRDVHAGVKAEVRRFFRHILYSAFRSPHGALIAVLPTRRKLARLLVDGLVLDPPIDVVHDVESYLRLRTEDTRAAVQGRAQLLEGMLRTDGITVLRTDGAIVAYNVFVRHGPLPAALIGQPVGGARRRTFETLRAHVGAELVAAFYRSQDGVADVASFDEGAPISEREKPPTRRPRLRAPARRDRPSRPTRRRRRRP
jgi:hypothetical protein